MIRTNSQKGTGTKMAEKLNNLKEKKGQISALFLTQRPLDDWPDALDHLAIGLVANKYTKLVKTSENLLLSQGVVLYKNFTVLSTALLLKSSRTPKNANVFCAMAR